MGLLKPEIDQDVDMDQNDSSCSFNSDTFPDTVDQSEADRPT